MRRKKGRDVRILAKRKNYRRLLAEKWLFVLPIMALIYFLTVYGFMQEKKNIAIDKFHKYTNSRVNEITESVKNEMIANVENNLKFHLAYEETVNEMNYLYDAIYDTEEACESCSLIYDVKTKEIVADSKEQLFLLNISNKESSRVDLVCLPADISGWNEHRLNMRQYYEDVENVYFERMEVSNIYTDGASFIPEELKVEVVKEKIVFPIPQGDDNVKTVFTKSFYADENIPTEYEKMDLSESYFTSIIALGYSADNLNIRGGDFNAASFELLEYEYERAQTDDDINRNWIRETPFTVKMLAEIEIILSKEQTVALLSASSIDLFEDYKGKLLIGGIGIFLFSVLVAILLAYVSYVRLRSLYALEDYRKTLTNTMAHDLKSPLMSISGYAENLRDNLNTEKQTYYSQAILNNVRYMNGIIESVLYLSKMEEGKLTLKKETLQVRAIVEKIVTEWEEKLQERGLKVEWAGDVQLEADVTLLEQLLCNLLDNAIKYALRDTTICVMMKDKEISIQNACEEDLSSREDTLCQPFVVGDTSRGNRKGSGLGLAIAKNICELHGFGFELICKEKSFEAKIKG